jgi:hypothetical protein
LKTADEEKSLVRGRAARRMAIFENAEHKWVVLHKAYVMAFLKTALANSAYSIAAPMSLPSVSDTFSQ